MWKKFLAAIALLAVFATASASALAVPAFPGNGGTPSYIDNYAVTPVTFNPSKGETTSVSFALAADAGIYIYAIDKDFKVYEIVGTGVAPVATTAGNKTFVWNGKNLANNQVLADGKYTVKSFAYVNGNVVDFDFKDVTIISTAADIITGFDVSKTTFDPSKGETVKIDFNLSQATTLNADIVDMKEKSHAVFADMQVTAAGAKSFTWLGKTNNAAADKVVPDGVYLLRLVAWDQGKIVDSEVKQLTVKTTTTVNGLQFKDLKVVPKEFAASSAESVQITFETTDGAYVKAQIKDGGTVKRTLPGYDGNKFYTAQKHSVSWDGKDDAGNILPVGIYTVVIEAKKNTEDTSGATTSENVSIISGCPINSTIIKNFCIDPGKTWDPTDGEELEIEFKLQKDVSSLRIDAVLVDKNGKTVKSIEIIDDDDADDGYYTETWDGTDDDGDYVDEGTWQIVVRADSDKVQLPVEVKLDQPDIIEAFVTKQSFDPSEDEVTNLVFKVNVKADVTVDIFKGNKKEMNLFKDKEVKKNKWYAVEWDGKDKDGEDVDFGTDWQFKVKAENVTDQAIKALETVEVDVEEDDVSDKKTNVTNDYTAPVIFDEDGYSSVQLSYVLDDNAEVFAAIYEGMSSTGKEKVELLDYVEQTAGYHTIDWNVTDKKGKALKNGIYTYKIISRANGGQKDTETGRFVVGSTGDFTQPKPPKPTPEVTACNDGIDNDGDGYADYYGTYYYGADPGCESAEDDDEYNDFYPPYPPYPPTSTCGGYSDTSKIATNNWEMCAAIEWVTNMGIFGGYADGTFGTYNNINRAEVLKVVLEAFPSAFILPKDGTAQGFPDVDATAWYMPYVRTAKFYGIMTGYPDGEAKLDRHINRVEFLKFVLESAEEFAGYSIPKYSYTGFKDVDFSDPKQDWFKDYAGVAWTMYLFDSEWDYESGKQYLRPADSVQRGEVALVLYKLYMNGVLGYEQPEYDMYGYPMGPTPYPYY